MKKFFSLVACLAVLMVSSVGCRMDTPTEGEKIGHIVKIAKEGFVCKTTEVQLVRGGLTGGSGSIGGAPFHFTIAENDKASLALAQNAMENGEEVLVKYQTPMLATLCSREATSDAVSVSIELAPNSKKPAVDVTVSTSEPVVSGPQLQTVPSH